VAAVTSEQHGAAQVGYLVEWLDSLCLRSLDVFGYDMSMPRQVEAEAAEDLSDGWLPELNDIEAIEDGSSVLKSVCSPAPDHSTHCIDVLQSPADRPSTTPHWHLRL
jgi:hypothetical protein